jgi:hypothetical protein
VVLAATPVEGIPEIARCALSVSATTEGLLSRAGQPQSNILQRVPTLHIVGT